MSPQAADPTGGVGTLSTSNADGGEMHSIGASRSGGGATAIVIHRASVAGSPLSGRSRWSPSHFVQAQRHGAASPGWRDELAAGLLNGTACLA